MCVFVALAAAALGPGRLVPQASAVVGNCTPSSTWGTVRQDFADRVVQLVNQHRASLGLTQLVVTTPLTSSSVWKARHMAYYLYMAHDDPAPPVARTTGQRLDACGYTGAGWGENIAAGQTTPESVMQAWLNSPGHRANIENASYRAIGVGAAVSSGGRLYWAQAFGTSTAGSATPPPVASLGRVTCNSTVRQVTVAAPTIYGRTTSSQLVGWRTSYMRWNGSTWIQGPYAPMRYAYATTAAPASQWLDTNGAVAASSVAQSVPSGGYWLAVQLFYWFDANKNVVASSYSYAATPTGTAAAGIPNASVCYWP